MQLMYKISDKRTVYKGFNLREYVVYLQNFQGYGCYVAARPIQQCDLYARKYGTLTVMKCALGCAAEPKVTGSIPAAAPFF